MDRLVSSRPSEQTSDSGSASRRPTTRFDFCSSSVDRSPIDAHSQFRLVDRYSQRSIGSNSIAVETLVHYFHLRSRSRRYCWSSLSIGLDDWRSGCHRSFSVLPKESIERLYATKISRHRTGRHASTLRLAATSAQPRRLESTKTPRQVFLIFHFIVRWNCAARNACCNRTRISRIQSLALICGVWHSRARRSTSIKWSVSSLSSDRPLNRSRFISTWCITLSTVNG